MVTQEEEQIFTIQEEDSADQISHINCWVKVIRSPVS